MSAKPTCEAPGLKIGLKTFPALSLGRKELEPDLERCVRRYGITDPPMLTFTIKYSEIGHELFEQMKQQAAAQETTQISFTIPEKRWVYPIWVWWKPKPENERYYRFLNIGWEETYHHKIQIQKALIVSVGTIPSADPQVWDHYVQLCVQGYGTFDA
jgi:hypothetical protein